MNACLKNSKVGFFVVLILVAQNGLYANEADQKAQAIKLLQQQVCDDAIELKKHVTTVKSLRAINTIHDACQANVTACQAFREMIEHEGQNRQSIKKIINDFENGNFNLLEFQVRLSQFNCPVANKLRDVALDEFRNSSGNVLDVQLKAVEIAEQEQARYYELAAKIIAALDELKKLQERENEVARITFMACMK